MDNDKLFAAYALILISGVVSTITASVMAGFASLPTALVFFEHVALGVAMRASYKFIGGFDWADWSFTRDRVAEAGEAEGVLSSSGPEADAKA